MESYTVIVLDGDGHELSKVEGCSTVVIAAETPDNVSHIERKGSPFAALGLLSYADILIRHEMEEREEV